jgi:hypothetical protein
MAAARESAWSVVAAWAISRAARRIACPLTDAGVDCAPAQSRQADETAELERTVVEASAGIAPAMLTSTHVAAAVTPKHARRRSVDLVSRIVS